MKPNRRVNAPQCGQDASVRYVQTRKDARRLKKAQAYVNWMFNWSPRYLVIVLTLNYEKEERRSVTLERILDDRAHLLANRSSNTVLAGILGYISNIEYGGKGGGFHMHCILFYSIEHALLLELDHVGVGNAICDYWKYKITGGDGGACNSNVWVPKALKLPYGNAVGLVAEWDVKKRASLHLYIKHYLIKEEQRVETFRGSRQLFVTGQVPEWVKSKTKELGEEERTFAGDSSSWPIA